MLEHGFESWSVFSKHSSFLPSFIDNWCQSINELRIRVIAILLKLNAQLSLQN